jgi:hypothetical protein
MRSLPCAFAGPADRRRLACANASGMRPLPDAKPRGLPRVDFARVIQVDLAALFLAWLATCNMQTQCRGDKFTRHNVTCMVKRKQMFRYISENCSNVDVGKIEHSLPLLQAQRETSAATATNSVTEAADAEEQVNFNEPAPGGKFVLTHVPTDQGEPGGTGLMSVLQLESV